ncbi:hypothetical protein THARTR1_02583 [Trichoderma harzianum]|uniref:Uncharacterized protein n=1 Tax=Trichoderma harzianum TaxID=5544 RepID=A0A2K0UIK7_TRIHA|nr:hypothetical protein THARTR1_02583 [Trichoderma harzianum]
MADAITGVSTVNEKSHGDMIEKFIKKAKKFMAKKKDHTALEEDFTKMEEALMTVKKILTVGDENLRAEKEICMVREEAIEAREKARESEEKVIKAEEKVINSKKKVIEAKHNAINDKENAIAAKERFIEAREKLIEAREKDVKIKAYTAVMGKKRDLTAMGKASEATEHKKARLGMSDGEIQANLVPATREPNTYRDNLHTEVKNKFVKFWKREAEGLQKGLDAAENAEVEIIVRAKKLTSDSCYHLYAAGIEREDAHSVIATGVRKLHEHEEFDRSIIVDLLAYLKTRP